MVKSTIALLCKCTSNLKKRKIDETPEQYLRQITHLYLNEKQLEEIGSEISMCKNLIVLYLYGNILKEIPDLSSSTQLTHLYLQNNNIHRIENLSSLVRLEKLFLSRNRISIIEGLEGLYSLQELRVDHQRLQPEECLLFDDQSLLSVAKTLSRLDVSGNRMENLEDLGLLSEITYLCASSNRLTNLKELTDTLKKWPKLKELEISDNPVMNTTRARETIIVNTAALEILDGKTIPQMTRKFLENWHQCKGTLVESSDDPVRPKDVMTSRCSLDTQLTEFPVSLGPSNDSIPLKPLIGDDYDLAQGESIHTPGEDNDMKQRLSKPLHGLEENSVGWESERFSLPSTETFGPLDRGESRSLKVVRRS